MCACARHYFGLFSTPVYWINSQDFGSPEATEEIICFTYHAAGMNMELCVWESNLLPDGHSWAYVIRVSVQFYEFGREIYHFPSIF